MIYWLLHFLGVEPRTPSTAYNFWSGFGSDISELSIPAAMVGLYMAHNCHTKGCWRLARHPVEGTPYKVCAKCHPTVPDGGPSRAHIHARHELAQIKGYPNG